jgi:hypothetical protein
VGRFEADISGHKSNGLWFAKLCAVVGRINRSGIASVIIGGVGHIVQIG